MNFREHAWQTGVAPRYTQIVNRPVELSGYLRSDVKYIVDGFIDMGSQTITVPQGGLSIAGLGFGVSRLYSSVAGHTLFTDDGVYSGDLFIDRIDLESSGTGANIFDLDNDQNRNAVETTNVNIWDTGSLGVLRNYRQGLWTNVALIRCVDGIECAGTWEGGFRADTAIIVPLGVAFTGTVFKAGAGLTMGGRFITDMNVESIDDTAAFCDFSPANIVSDGRFQVSGLSVNPNSNSFPNMPSSSVKARFRNCDGVPNTYVGGQYKIGTEVATNIVTQGVPVKIAGATPYTDLQHFTGAVDNSSTYIGTQEIGVNMYVDISFTGPNNDELTVTVRHWVDGSSSYVDLTESGKFTLGIAGRSAPISLHSFGTLNKNDRLEVWVTNTSSNGDVTAVSGGIVSISERSS